MDEEIIANERWAYTFQMNFKRENYEHHKQTHTNITNNIASFSLF